jgi:hypothetical protein
MLLTFLLCRAQNGPVFDFHVVGQSRNEAEETSRVAVCITPTLRRIHPLQSTQIGILFQLHPCFVLCLGAYLAC